MRRHSRCWNRSNILGYTHLVYLGILPALATFSLLFSYGHDAPLLLFLGGTVAVGVYLAVIMTYTRWCELSVSDQFASGLGSFSDSGKRAARAKDQASRDAAPKTPGPGRYESSRTNHMGAPSQGQLPSTAFVHDSREFAIWGGSNSCRLGECSIHTTLLPGRCPLVTRLLN